MSVIEVNAISTQQTPGSKPHDRIYQSLYQVITDDYNDSPVRIYVQTNKPGVLYLPQVGDYYNWDNVEFDTAAFVTKQPVVTLRDVKSTRRLWTYSVTHTTESTKRDNTTRYANPLNEPWTVNLTGDEWTEEEFIDAATGALLGNSSLQVWTGRETEIYKSRSGWSLSKNNQTLLQNYIDYTRGHVNSQTVIIKGRNYTPRTLLLRTVDAEELHNAMVGFYWKYTFKLDTDYRTFDIQVPDRGTKSYVGTDPKDPTHYSDILDPYTKHAVSPPGVLLDGSGGANPTAAAPFIMRQQKYPLADLNVWKFPSV